MKTNEYSPAAFKCLQEVLHSQLQDVLGGLNDINSTSATKTPKWSYIGIAREDGRQQGEYSPLLYSSDTFNLLYSENTWLSSTPNKPSKPWYAGSVRVLTLGVFEHKMTGERILSANTHLDNSSSKARREGIIRVLERLEQMKSKWSLRNREMPVFLGGDFNSFPTQEAYKEMVKRKAMADVFTLVQPTQRYGDIKTFTAFGPKQDVSEQGRIDFVWLRPFSKVKSADYSIPTTTTTPTSSTAEKVIWQVDGYATMPNIFDGNVYSSDHRCVVADMTLFLA